jgi:TonB-linked SusC/RagA family outer membrane protein
MVKLTKAMKKIAVLITLLCFNVTCILAQVKIEGNVLDDEGIPVSNATIGVKDGSKTTLTKEDGSFSLNIPVSVKTLMVTSTGFIPQEIQASSGYVKVILKAAGIDLSEVVVVAYGTKKEVNMTGSVATVKSSDIANRPFTSVDKTLQGAVAGLLSTSASGAPGSNTDIRIRGTGSITANASPLWVIDGVIASTGNFSVNTTTTNALSSLNSDDIESISVLKDAAATSLYGSLAANGVIIVNTKKGKAGKTNINFVAESGQNSVAFQNDNNRPMTTAENQKVMQEALINAGFASNDSEANTIIMNPSYVSNFNPLVNTNWQDAVTQKGSQQQYNLSVSGGNDKTQIYASGGYFKQLGSTIATDYERYNGNISVISKVNDKLIFKTNVNGSSSLQHTPKDSGYYSNPALAAAFLVPWYTPYNKDGSLRYNDAQGEFSPASAPYNPVALAALNKSSLQTVTLRGSVSGEYQFAKELKFTSRYSAEYLTLQENPYQNPFYGSLFSSYNRLQNDPSGYSAASFTSVFDYTWDNYFDYKKDLNKAKNIYFDLKAGYEVHHFNYYTLQAAGDILPHIQSALPYLATATTPKVAYDLPSTTAANAFFSTGDINYKDRYVISGSFRRDGSSVFGANNRYGNFYSVGGTWNISEEDFLKHNKVLSLLKLRTSYGTTGNATGFGYYTSLNTYGYGYNYAGSAGSVPNNVGDPNLTWETNKIFDVGVDIGILKNRITGTVDYYDRQTSNLILNVPFSLTSGFAGQNQNAGGMDNKGIEITLAARPIQLKNFTWDIAFNISHNTNKVTALYNNRSILTAQSAGLFYNYTVGSDLQTFYLPQWAGVDPATGGPLWYTDGTHKVTTDDYTKASYVLNPKYSSAPKYFGSFTNNFKYKNVSLAVQFYYNFGNYFYDDWAGYTLSDGYWLGYFNQSTEELKAWKKPGDITNVPQVVYFGSNPNSAAPSTRFLYKDDYIRLRNIELAYTFPASTLKKIGFTNLNVYVRGTNLLTFATDKDIPYDPESGITTTSNFEVYIPKTITLGLKAGF